MKFVPLVLLVLNGVVLLGQVWPDGAPPFGRTLAWSLRTSPARRA